MLTLHNISLTIATKKYYHKKSGKIKIATFSFVDVTLCNNTEAKKCCKV